MMTFEFMNNFMPYLIFINVSNHRKILQNYIRNKDVLHDSLNIEDLLTFNRKFCKNQFINEIEIINLQFHSFIVF
jgi:hypothetical protein